ncbi:sensor histidine kinase [Lysobacter changpingensis]|uniref:sensor histidine kinase n=1 Tax=Lysobacter changpingensis TaxID=2792784 RepID=UPI001A8F1D9E|nr:sensor histidine kinase [Lysobacter changpingensis]
MRLLGILLFALLAATSHAMSAAGSRPLERYVHQRWIEGSEVPVPVVAMAQGHYGFLWLATGDGLFRFDGLRFEPITAEPDDRKHESPSALLVTAKGEVWTSFESSRQFAVYRDGALRILAGAPAPSRIVQMVEGTDGSIWALTADYNAEVLRYRNGDWRTYDAADGLPKSNAANLLVARDGALWVACTTGIARLAPGASRFEIVRPAVRAKLSQDELGRIWLFDAGGMRAITGAGGRGEPPAPHASGNARELPARGTPLFDRGGNIWIATRYDGVQRIAAPIGAPGDAAVESFTARDGLSSDVTNQVLEDREGNVWIGTQGGLDRFRPATLIAQPGLSSPAAYGDKLLAASDGSVYIGQAQTLYRARPHGAPEPVLRDMPEPESLCEAPDGAIWIGTRTHILVWADGRIARRIERPDRQAAHNVIYDCAFDAQGDYWISAAGSGVHRLRRGEWTTQLQPGTRIDFYPTTMERSPSGGVVVQVGDRLAWFGGPEVKYSPLDFGGGDIKVLTLYTAGRDVYTAGAFGLSRHRNGKVETARAPGMSPRSRINGVVRTPEGDTWLAYPRSLVRLTQRELDAALAKGELPGQALSLGPGDGLGSRAHSHSQRSLVLGGDGRLWLATETGTLSMDPARILSNRVPPGVFIRSIDVDGRAYRDPRSVRLHTGASKIQIDFAILSFADQQRVHVRYKLEGFDREWVDPGLRRQAFYTNLPPGHYTFRVIAANNDGVWNRTGATLDFEIPPTFVQSVWFPVLCAGVALVLLIALYRLRIAQVAARIRARLEERTEERERIARELHDTLLQGVQGLILRFQAVADRIAPDDGSKSQLDSALAAADDVVADARNRVRDLRGTGDAGDLTRVIEHLVEDTPFDPPVPVRIVIEGRPVPVHPLVVAEVSKILREALLNVSHHAQASSVEIGIGYDSRQLAVRVRDDGVGIPSHVVLNGHKEGHYGMLGMRERAEKIGGKLTVTSIHHGGSEVTLSLPGRLAFARRASHRRHRWLSRLFGMRSADE